MKAVNLYMLTRTKDPEAMSSLFSVLAGLPVRKSISPHEAACLYELTDLIADTLKSCCFHGLNGESAPSDSFNSPENDRISLFDGFYFSYIIEHIGKEFDLLKISSDGECILNIELKSEDIGETRIKKQLEQNRYYLSHASGTIYSFTYVMETGKIYALNDRNHLRECSPEDLLAVIEKPDLRDYLPEGIERFFKSSDYLISPVAVPEKFLQRQYFLTNQQYDFKRRILDHMKKQKAPVIVISGSAGTGKTLLLFDLALDLSRKSKVLLMHAGPLRQGHVRINERLKNVDIVSGAGGISAEDLSEYSYLLIDETEHLGRSLLENLLRRCGALEIPVILTHDPHLLLGDLRPRQTDGEGSDIFYDDETQKVIAAANTLYLEFTGNIRINRPIYHFLRMLFHPKDLTGHPDYGSIEVLYAGDADEMEAIARHYLRKGYEWVHTEAPAENASKYIAKEYGRVFVVMDEDFYYDDAGHLRVKEHEEASLCLLYEALSLTREGLCLLIKGNPKLFAAVMGLRLGGQ